MNRKELFSPPIVNRDLLLGRSGPFPTFSTFTDSGWYSRAQAYISLNTQHVFYGAMEGVAGGVCLSSSSTSLGLTLSTLLALDGVRRVSSGSSALRRFTDDMQLNNLQVTRLTPPADVFSKPPKAL